MNDNSSSADNSTEILISVWEPRSGYDNETTEQMVFIFWMFCNLLSVLSCWMMMHENIQDLHKGPSVRQRSAHDRLVQSPFAAQFISMSIGYFSLGFGLFLGPIPVPIQMNVWGALGTFATCEAQGFFINIGSLGASMVNASVIAFYTFKIRFNWSDDRLWKLIPWINVVAWSAACAIALLPLFHEAYNYGGFTCGVVPLPLDCLDDPLQPCTRGGNASFFRVFEMLQSAVYLSCVLCMLLNLGLIYSAVRQAEDHLVRYSFQAGVTPSQSGSASLDYHQNNTSDRSTATTRSRANRKKSSAVAAQAKLYIAVFLTSFLSFIIASISRNQLVWHIQMTLVGLMGFLNAVVFVRPRERMRTWEGCLFRRLVCCTCLRSKVLSAGESARSSRYRSSVVSHSSKWEDANACAVEGQLHQTERDNTHRIDIDAVEDGDKTREESDDPSLKQDNLEPSMSDKPPITPKSRGTKLLKKPSDGL